MSAEPVMPWRPGVRRARRAYLDGYEAGIAAALDAVRKQEAGLVDAGTFERTTIADDVQRQMGDVVALVRAATGET